MLMRSYFSVIAYVMFTKFYSDLVEDSVKCLINE